MDYKEQTENLLYDAKDWSGDPHIKKDLSGAAQSITDLLARAEAAEARVLDLETTHRTEMCEVGYDCTELGKVRKALQAAESKLDEAKRYDWISVEERLPVEHDSIFKKLIDDEKWRAGMFKTLSDDVIVAVKFADGTRKTGVTHTKDGIWTGLPSIGCPIVTHWMPMPEPPEEVMS